MHTHYLNIYIYIHLIYIKYIFYILNRNININIKYVYLIHTLFKYIYLIYIFLKAMGNSSINFIGIIFNVLTLKVWACFVFFSLYRNLGNCYSLYNVRLKELASVLVGTLDPENIVRVGTIVSCIASDYFTLSSYNRHH